MASPGFEKRFRDHIGSEDFDDLIQNFMRRYAKTVIDESIIYEGKTSEGVTGGEFPLEVDRIWKEYLALIENHMKRFQEEEGLSDMEFKRSIEDIYSSHPILVRLMIASWEFPQFLEVCKEYTETNTEDSDDEEEYKYGKV